MKLREKYQLISDLVGNDVMFTKIHASSRSELSKSLRQVVERFKFEIALSEGFTPDNIGEGKVQNNNCFIYEYVGKGIYEVYVHHHKEKNEFESFRELWEWPTITRALKTETLQGMSKEKLTRHTLESAEAARTQIKKHSRN